VKSITDGPNNNYDFGESFNYAVWTEGTAVTLTNVPWNNDYRDVCHFPTPLGLTLDQYIDSHASVNDTLTNVSYLKFGQPVRVNIPFNSAFKFNYLRVQNSIQGVSGDTLKSYYYFILGANYIAPNTTELILQLDIFQSFRNDFTFGNCYIERGHIGIANQHASDNYGRDYLTVPEGIDYGGEYQIIGTKHNEIMSASQYGNAAGVLIVSTTDLNADAGSVTAPKLTTAPGSTFEGLVSGASYYYFPSAENFRTYIKSIADTPWVSQGIISITFIPTLDRYQTAFVFPVKPNDPTDVSNYVPGTKITKMFNGWRTDPAILNAIPARYNTVKAKFFTSPYMVIEMTTWTGKAIILKPESWNDPDATIAEFATLTPPNQRIVFTPRHYNAVNGADVANKDYGPDLDRFPANWHDGGDDSGDYLDMATMVDNFPTMAIVNNGALSYLASNFAGIPYQKQSAAWSQSRALRGNEVSYDQTKAGIAASKQANTIGNAATQGQAASNNLAISQGAAANTLANMLGGGLSAAGASGAVGVVSSLASGVASGLMTSVNAGIQTDANNRSANISTISSRSANTVQNTQTSYVNDTNKGLADWAARGDYENSIAGVNAQVNDASMIQPSTSGQAGGETFNLVNGNMQVSLRWKLVDNAAIRTLGDYWLRYGYSVRKFGSVPNSLMAMSKFTYWKLQETYITSANMPEGFKQIIRGIFEKGVTVWASPDYIGNTDLADNAPIGGLTL